MKLGFLPDGHEKEIALSPCQLLALLLLCFLLPTLSLLFIGGRRPVTFLSTTYSLRFTVKQLIFLLNKDGEGVSKRLIGKYLTI